MEWCFDVRNRTMGAISGDRAVLLTHDATGRLIQLAVGSILADGRTGERRVQVGEVYGARGK